MGRQRRPDARFRAADNMMTVTITIDARGTFEVTTQTQKASGSASIKDGIVLLSTGGPTPLFALTLKNDNLVSLSGRTMLSRKR
jgi:hypothetical protein